MEKQDESLYIMRILNGETHLYSIFIDNYSKAMYALIVQIVNSPEYAEELVQDSFLKAFKSLASYNGDCRFSTWLYRISYNIAISATRKRPQPVCFIDENTINSVSDELASQWMEESESQEKISLLIEAIEKLMPDEKALITLFYMEEKSIEEVSKIMKLTTANIKVRLHRTRKKLYLLMTKNYQ